ncbi:unnamed protein product [Rotaria sp. Silwood2]|nr:unnamed protein product [Rotaria sp. Silwood2]CAF3110853.1 unnamed protein product [Rotaria sp. Silwood2]CAF4426073.1 unnamed protein product [Rotaria sp. Silwood2]CAF4657262.1 unnamed protein product [Rotaria sp. Silwood2]
MKYNAMKVWTELNSESYQQLHHELLYRPTRRENEAQLQTSAQLIPKPKHYEHKDQIYLHYTFESGSLINFKKEYRQIWGKYYVYSGSRLKSTRLIIGTILNRTLQSLLIHKKPKRVKLTKMESTTQAAFRTIHQLLPH